MSVRDNLKSLCLIPAISGYEHPVAHFMEQAFISYGLKPVTDVLGNCTATVQGTDT